MRDVGAGRIAGIANGAGTPPEFPRRMARALGSDGGGNMSIRHRRRTRDARRYLIWQDVNPTLSRMADPGRSTLADPEQSN
jgi:hypothetical protein